MLSRFDWLRRCRTGTELLATLSYFSKDPSLADLNFGPPFSATKGPCLRCLIYAPVADGGKYRRYCKFCREILIRKRWWALKSSRAVVIWGYVNHIPRQLQEFKPSRFIYGAYIHDRQHFLLSMHRQHLREWLQELALYDGLDLGGLIQIFPTLGQWRSLNMGDYLTWAIHHEAACSMDRLWVRFFTQHDQLINPKIDDQKGILTWTDSEFLSLLEMTEAFRANIYSEEQKDLYELLILDDPTQEQFYWGRFLGRLSREAKDMLTAWKIRAWPKERVKLLYKLINYVILP